MPNEKPRRHTTGTLYERDETGVRAPIYFRADEWRRVSAAARAANVSRTAFVRKVTLAYIAQAEMYGYGD